MIVKLAALLNDINLIQKKAMITLFMLHLIICNKKNRFFNI